MKNLRAFTLAEVLIVLGIIGVVAAMTLSLVIKHYQQQIVVQRLKKAYSEFSQTIQKAEQEHGLLETWDFADFETSQDRATYFGENYLFPYIKTIKKCLPTTNECWADNVKPLGTGAYASNLTNNQAGKESFITASGYTVLYWLHGNGTGMWYVVDINGLTKPNKVGRDIFAFQANWGKTTDSKYGVYPVGLERTETYSRDSLITGDGFYDKNRTCNKGSNIKKGQTCASIIMLDGWKIKDDYPW